MIRNITYGSNDISELGGHIKRAVLENCRVLVETQGVTHRFTALKGDRPIASAHVLSDDALCTWIHNIQVTPEWRWHGIGRMLMNMANTRFCHTPLWAGAPEALIPFFVTCGLNPKAKLKPCMRPDHSLQVKGPTSMAHPDQQLNFTTDTRLLDMNSLGALFEAVGFGTAENYQHDALSVEKLFGPGVFGFLVFDDERLVGLARVLSDEVLCTWVSEVCVHPDYQRRGIGNALLDMVNARFPDTALYADAFKGQEPFFAQHGINPQSRVVACGRAPLKA